MVKVHFSEKPEKIKYMPLPDGIYVDVRLRVNIEHFESEDVDAWTADEHYFRASSAYMTETYVEEHFDDLLGYEPDEEEEPTETLLLEMAANHEYRICLLEMGVEL